MQEWNAKHFDSKENVLAKDLKHGDEIRAAVLLLDECHQNPEEFKALVKRSMAIPEGSTKLHLNVAANGDVFVWDKNEKSGIYAGTAKELAPKADCPADQTKTDAAAFQPPIAVPVAQADAPPPADATPVQPIAVLPQGEIPPPDAIPATQQGLQGDARPPQASCAPEHDFRGLNLGLIRIGVYDHKSLGLGVNIGIAKGDGMIGGHTGAEARVGMASLGACGAAGLDIDQNGLAPGVRGRLNVANVIGGGAEGGVVLGPQSSVNAGVEGEALGAHAHVKEQITANDQGLGGSHSAGVGFLDLVGVKHRAHAELSDDSHAGSNVKAFVGPASVEVGSGIDTNRNTTLTPGAYIDFGAGPEHSTLHVSGQVGPSYDVSAQIGVAATNTDHPENWQNNALQAGVGVNGAGIKAVDESPQGIRRSSFGVGRDYGHDYD